MEDKAKLCVALVGLVVSAIIGYYVGCMVNSGTVSGSYKIVSTN